MRAFAPLKKKNKKKTKKKLGGTYSNHWTPKGYILHNHSLKM
jgi:hypothetical protein